MGVAGGDPLSTAVAVARAHGLCVEEPVVLRDRLNLLVHLRPAPVVARVAGTIAKLRPGDEWVRRELAVAGRLAAAGAPVVAPSGELPPGPHAHGGHVVSFWTHVPPGEPDPLAACAALRELRAPVQPLHGDAHLGNVLAGRLWNDWEDTRLGPIGWDAACLVLYARAAGREAEARGALDAAGIAIDPGELALWLEARTLQATAWIAFVAREHPERRAALEPWLQAARLSGT